MKMLRQISFAARKPFAAVDGASSTLAARRRASNRAFTLVEILVAIGIFSMVLAAIYSTWTAILRASKVGLEAAAAVQRARIAGRTIEETLGSVQCFESGLLRVRRRERR